MINRLAIQNTFVALQQAPAAVLLGARQIGKSTLARQIATQYPGSIYLDLEDMADMERISTPGTFFERNKDKLIIIDEIQRIPQLYSALRPAIDKHRVPGRFLVLGSASPQLVKGVSESLAGRVQFVHLDPVNHTEATQNGIDMQQHWFRGGFPMALTAQSDQQAASWLDNFISTYIERDLSWLFGRDFSRSVMRNFWGIAAHNNGTIWNASSYSRSLGVSMPTVKHYAELLEGGFLLRLLPAWYLNAEKRLIKSPKIYWRDSGLLHRICRVASYDQLFEHPVVGGSWEGYVVEQIAQHKHPDLDMYYYRTQNGAECDVVLTRSIKPVACIEIKLNNLPKLSEGYFKCIGDLKTKHNYIVTPEGITSPYYGATACSLQTFLNEFLPILATIRPKK